MRNLSDNFLSTFDVQADWPFCPSYVLFPHRPWVVGDLRPIVRCRSGRHHQSTSHCAGYRPGWVSSSTAMQFAGNWRVKSASCTRPPIVRHRRSPPSLWHCRDRHATTGRSQPVRASAWPRSPPTLFWSFSGRCLSGPIPTDWRPNHRRRHHHCDRRFRVYPPVPFTEPIGRRLPSAFGPNFSRSPRPLPSLIISIASPCHRLPIPAIRCPWGADDGWNLFVLPRPPVSHLWAWFRPRPVAVYAVADHRLWLSPPFPMPPLPVASPANGRRSGAMSGPIVESGPARVTSDRPVWRGSTYSDYIISDGFCTVSDRLRTMYTHAC